MSAGNILDLIDSAVHDWETSPDAVRYNAPAPAETFTEVRFDTRPADLPPPPLGATAIRMASEFQRFTAALSRDEREDFTTYWRSRPWTFEQAREHWAASHTPRPITFAEAVEGLRVALCAATAGICKVAREIEYSHAARDYRRRTKHRNRRR